MANRTVLFTAPVKDLLRMVASFLIAHAIVSTIFVGYFVVIDTPEWLSSNTLSTGFGLLTGFLIVGLIIALPVLLIASVVLLVLHSNISRNLAIWCVFSSIIVVVIYPCLDHLAFNGVGKPILEHLQQRSTIGRTAIVLVVSVPTAVIFYFWKSRTRLDAP